MRWEGRRGEGRGGEAMGGEARRCDGRGGEGRGGDHSRQRQRTLARDQARKAHTLSLLELLLPLLLSAPVHEAYLLVIAPPLLLDRPPPRVAAAEHTQTRERVGGGRGVGEKQRSERRQAGGLNAPRRLPLGLVRSEFRHACRRLRRHYSARLGCRGQLLRLLLGNRLGRWRRLRERGRPLCRSGRPRRLGGRGGGRGSGGERGSGGGGGSGPAVMLFEPVSQSTSRAPSLSRASCRCPRAVRAAPTPCVGGIANPCFK